MGFWDFVSKLALESVYSDFWWDILPALLFIWMCNEASVGDDD